ncbi:MAG: hypothetical protein CMO01_19470 [Thalassobius sp.]|nr:hypothetical protein [Thalassovita sp.]
MPISRYLMILGMLAITTQSYCQRFGYVNTDEIYKNLPEYQSAVAEIDNLINNWNREIKEKKMERSKLMQQFEIDAPLLTQELKNERLEEIRKIDQELREFQNNRFGYKGMLTIKKEQVIDPIVEKVFKATERVAKIKNVDFLFDVASDLSLPYVRPSKDYTDFVLEQLGVSRPKD